MAPPGFNHLSRAKSTDLTWVATAAIFSLASIAITLEAPAWAANRLVNERAISATKSHPIFIEDLTFVSFFLFLQGKEASAVFLPVKRQCILLIFFILIKTRKNRTNGSKRSAGKGNCTNRTGSHRTSTATEGLSFGPRGHLPRLSSHPNCDPRPLPRSRMSVRTQRFQVVPYPISRCCAISDISLTSTFDIQWQQPEE
ncbi:pumilio domain-containing protein [Striga asiatica]|uniref:Pumilio domain-containing protein n=1 Tax=Striga asiatica TaxID=4170 RepID=A0A5A7QQW6_STRAF|nr:pumilio domain-containing protein [Striga asiatica]